MKTTIKGDPSFSYLIVQLEPGETITAEAGAMATMDARLDMRTQWNGGFFSAIMKRFFGGESMFINEFSNNTQETLQLTLVQACPGNMTGVELKDQEICLQPGAYICSTTGLTFKMKWAGFKSWFAKEGLFKQSIKGTGTLWYGAYGALYEKEVDGEYIVDTAHLVAYDPQIKLKIQLAGGLFASLFSGEGFVTRVEGKGKIVMQTRSLSGLKDWLNPKLW